MFGIIKYIWLHFECWTRQIPLKMLWGFIFKSVINPIPKGSNKDLFVQLNYRGIRLLSCVGKVFSGIINKRIVN